ncbi:hypothetical protein KJ780_03700 [Candidatus Micrarchaeota archaeon]|nr:hypothetical protein [Candidatus Micrarchaeota archaeon]
MEKRELQKIISLTFDEKPSVRKEAALRLAESDDPGATFALLELSYDKDEKVKATARDILSKRQTMDKNAISFAEIFGSASNDDDSNGAIPEATDGKKRKLLQPIERIFDKGLGKTKSAMVKSKMMPTIEKVYKKAVGSEPVDMEKREKSIQRMLTSYVDIISGLDVIMSEEERAAREIEVQSIPEEVRGVVQEELESIGAAIEPEKISKELDELVSVDEPEAVEIPEAVDEEQGGKTIFKRAFEIMMACDGDEQVMFQQSQKMIKQMEDDVKLAFKMAKQRFKAANITHLTELKNGMRNVNTDELLVKIVTQGEYARTKTKMDTYTRIIVNDNEGSEGIIYLFDGRGTGILPEMMIKVEKGQVKTFAFSGETAVTISKKGKVCIVL